MPLVGLSGGKAWKLINEETGETKTISEATAHASEINELFNVCEQIEALTERKKALVKDLSEKLTASVTTDAGKLELRSNPEKWAVDEDKFIEMHPEYCELKPKANMLKAMKDEFKKTPLSEQSTKFPFFEYTPSIGKTLSVKLSKK